MSDDTIGEGIPAIIEAARANKGAEVIDALGGGMFDPTDLPGMSELPSIPVLLLPSTDGSIKSESVLAEVKAWRDTFAERPLRREGTAKLDEIESFIAHALRFKDPDSAIFVTGGSSSPSFLSVLDYHEAVNAPGVLALPPGTTEPMPPARAAAPRFGKHRGTFSPKFSPEWSTWTAANGKTLTQEMFATLINANVRDVLDLDEAHPDRLTEAPAWFARRFAGGRAPAEFFASAQRLLDVAEGLTVTVSDRVSDVTRRDSGEVKISFESMQIRDVEVPVAFVLELPIFVGGDLFQIPVRVRFNVRTEGDTKRAQWRIEMFGAERTVLACIADMRKTIADKTGLPIFAGTPE
jgi:hypothetical protein